MQDEAALIAAAKAGDQDAFTELYNRHAPIITRQLCGLSRHSDVADLCLHALREPLQSAAEEQRAARTEDIAGIHNAIYNSTYTMNASPGEMLQVPRNRRRLSTEGTK